MITYCLDPGRHGSLVVLDNANPIKAIPLPYYNIASQFYPKTNTTENTLDFEKLLASLQSLPRPDFIIVEHPLALPGNAIQTTAISFKNWGVLFSCLTHYASSIGLKNDKIAILRPNTWVTPIHQRFCVNPFEGDTKKRSKEAFARVWPDIDMKSLCKGNTKEGVIDAALLGFYWLWANNLLTK